jgi:hypothetical protein
LPDPPKFTQIGIFGLKMYYESGNPAALARRPLYIQIKLALARKTFYDSFAVNADDLIAARGKIA